VSARPFTQVRIKGAGAARVLSYGEFLALPIHERIRHILDRDIEFLRDDQTVEWREALAWLRSESATK
jgi:hypothetical protein